MAHVPPELQAHKEWLGQIQQVGLVVSPSVLVRQGVFIDRQKSVEKQERLRELTEREDDNTLRVIDWPVFCREILEWPQTVLAGLEGGPPLADNLTVALPEYEDRLSPSCAVPDPDREGEWLLLVRVEESEVDFDSTPPPDRHQHGWRTSPHARMERLLRETGVPIGLLFNGVALRLVYAPRGESSGHLTFRFSELEQTLGRPMVGALYALLGVERVTDVQQEGQRLPALLKESRKYQNEVSTELAGQVLEALWELVRGFERANQHSHGLLLTRALQEAPNDVYGGLLATLMRLVFVLYAEDRGLMPPGEVYQKHYSISGLFERLRDDEARYPDTMDARYGAWAQLLVLFRLIHDGGAHGEMRFPARHGRLFNPDAYPFLEGRPLGIARVLGDTIDPPYISDGVVFRVLKNLLILDSERLSYRALDVEQIGSVYEAMMGFALQQASGPSLATTPKHVVFNIVELLEQKPKERGPWLQKETELKATGDALAKAASVDEVVAALGKRLSRYTPNVLPAGAMYLQPTEERRRSGSHYTPRSLTEPIVRTAFRPILERLGEDATPEQILDLKVCDPAMGSGAFLVEACRLLSERLVRAWEVHKQIPKVPNDEDLLTYARRLVAERCLYGVDKNIFAVDLAKLSLWLATLARQHPFTFLDHAVRHGDSLVGLSREQIACFSWDADKQLPLVRGLIDKRVNEAQRLREQIQGLAPTDDFLGKERLWREATEALADVRLIGDLALSAFFQSEKPKDRQILRTAYSAQVQGWLAAQGSGAPPPTASESKRLSSPFHWEIEFPEVFARSNGGFDAFVGNPPFLGGTRISTVLGMVYFDYLRESYAPAGHLCDLIAYFFRRSYSLLRTGGTFGLIATNTIAQGDTRAGGLEQICEATGTIFQARRRLKWPGRAAVMVSLVHVLKGRYDGGKALDERRVDRITAYLLTHGGNSAPARLAGRNELFSAGSKIYGQGFVFDDTDSESNPISEMKRILADEPQSATRIKPYIGGDELNSSPEITFSRYVIDLNDIAEESGLAVVPLLADLVRRRVKPDRDRLGSNPNNIPLKRRWWAYQAHRPSLYAALKGMDRALAISQTTKYLSFAFVPNNWVFSQKLNVLLFEDFASFALLQCRLHEIWSLAFGSTMKDDPVYTPSDCFETYPFPQHWKGNADLARAGRDYEEFRRTLMIRNGEGLTDLYNRFHDPDESHPDLLHLRELHELMDRVVLETYGWVDVRPRCDFILDYEDDEDETPGKPSKKKKPWHYRWPDDLRDEVLGRLLELNAQRAKDEGLAGKQANPAKKRRGATISQATLLE